MAVLDRAWRYFEVCTVRGAIRADQTSARPRIHPGGASSVAEVWFDVTSVDACQATFDRKRADDMPVEQVSQDRVGLSKEALEGIEETRRLRDASRGEQGHHMCAERGEEIGITWRRVRWKSPPVRSPLGGERRERPAQGRFEI